MNTLSSSPSVLIQAVSVNEATVLSALAEETFRQAFAEQNDPVQLEAYIASALTPEVMAAELNDPNSRFFMAFNAANAGPTPMGYAKLRKGREEGTTFAGENPWELQRIYVSNAYCGKGVAQHLMNHCIQTAQQLGADVLWLGVWEHNLRAQRFYQKFGFEIVGTHFFHIGTDCQTDFIMAKFL